MRCHICNSVLTTPNYNEELQGYEPCDTCMSVIMDTLKSYEDVAAASEEDLSDDSDVDIVLLWYPEETDDEV